jgi:O-antigen/teichoic acid export membrane protein
MSLLKRSALSAAAGIILTSSRFALAAVLARRLTSTGFGQFVYTQWLIDIIILICSLGITGAASRYVAEYQSDSRRLVSFLTQWRRWAGCLPVLSACSIIVVTVISGTDFNIVSLIFLALWGLASGVWAMQTAALIGFQRFDLIFQANCFSAIIMLGGCIFLPLSSDNPATLFGIMAAAAGVAAARGIHQTHCVHRERSKSIERGEWSQIRHYAANTWLISIIGALLWSRGELPIVKFFMGDAGIASYAAALTLFAGAIQGVTLGVGAVTPQLTRLWGSGQKSEALRTARKVMDIQLLVCGVAATLLSCFGTELLVVAFGAKFEAQARVLAILATGLVSMALVNQSHLLQIVTDGSFSRNQSFCGLILLMALAFGMIPAWGLEGAVFSRVITMAGLALASAFAAHRRWGPSAISFANLFRVGLIVSCCAMVVAVFPLSPYERGGLMCLSLVILILSVRDESGKTEISLLNQNLIAGGIKLRAKLRASFND